MTKANKDIKRVNCREYELAYDEMVEKFNSLTGMDGSRRIQFYFDEAYGEPGTMSVNWAAIGTTTPEEALEFGKALMVAATLAAGFKFNGYKRSYSED